MLTADEADGRARAAVEFDRYLQAPSYRHMFELEGVTGPAAIALVGNERTLTTAIGRLRDSGVTDLNLQRFGDTDEQQRTTEFLRSL